jgi:hypothetical protein
MMPVKWGQETMKTYNLYIQRSLKILIIIVIVVLLTVALLLISGVLKDKRGQGPPRFMGVFFLAVAGVNAYFYVLRIPHRINVTDDGHIEFISLVRRKIITSREISSIAPDAGQVGFYTIKTERGKIRILNQFDGFHEFLTWLKANNPSVELRGC